MPYFFPVIYFVCTIHTIFFHHLGLSSFSLGRGRGGGISEGFYSPFYSPVDRTNLILYTLSHFNCLFCLPCYIHTPTILKANVLAVSAACNKLFVFLSVHLSTTTNKELMLAESSITIVSCRTGLGLFMLSIYLTTTTICSNLFFVFILPSN